MGLGALGKEMKVFHLFKIIHNKSNKIVWIYDCLERNPGHDTLVGQTLDALVTTPEGFDQGRCG